MDWRFATTRVVRRGGGSRDALGHMADSAVLGTGVVQMHPE